MAYFVLGDQGQKYGPADIATLNQWISEGRLLAHTVLQDDVTGVQLAAQAVPGLQFAAAAPAAPPAGPPMSSNYPRYGQAPQPQTPQYQYQPQQYKSMSDGAGNSDFGIALALGLVSPVLSFLFPIGGLLTAGYGIRAAFRAKEAGHAGGIIVIVLNILAICFWVFTRFTGFGRGLFMR